MVIKFYGKCISIPNLRNEKGTGVEMCLAIVSGIVTGDATIPEVFAKVNSSQFLLVSKVSN